MVAPLAAAGAAAAAQKPIEISAKAAKQILTGDLAIVRGSRKGKRTGSVDYEVHVNPLGIGLGAGVIALGSLVAWSGISVPGATLFPGVKDSSWGRRASEWAQKHNDNAQQRGGWSLPSLPGTSPGNSLAPDFLPSTALARVTPVGPIVNYSPIGLIARTLTGKTIF